jgi:hypothetical protein
VKLLVSATIITANDRTADSAAVAHDHHELDRIGALSALYIQEYV